MSAGEWAIFNDDAADWSAEESVEAGFCSREEAENVIFNRYCGMDDGLFVHECEEPEDEEDDEDTDIIEDEG